MKTVQVALCATTLALIAACSMFASSATGTQTAADTPITIKAEVWADNWFALYSNDTLIKEDSVPITTERSFNSERFTFQASYPLHLNIVAKDYKANDTGLEYIGTPRQQIGDGGLKAQFTDVATGKIIAVTDQNAKVMVIHKAPLEPACAKEANPVAGQGACRFTSMLEPSDWKSAGFADRDWSKASVFTAAEVGPKDGYLDIAWNEAAQFIWGSDLLTDNTVLMRMTATAP